MIFVNHEKSEEWINLFRKKVNSEYPFLSIWTIHLRFKKGGKEVNKAVAQKIAPFPCLRIVVDTTDLEIHKPQPIPTYMEQHKSGEITIKSEFIDKLKNKIKNI